MRTWSKKGQSEADLVDYLFSIPLSIVFRTSILFLQPWHLDIKKAATLDLLGCFRSDQHSSNIDKLRQVRS